MKMVDIVHQAGGKIYDPCWPPSPEVVKEIEEGGRGIIVDWGLPETGAIFLGVPPTLPLYADFWEAMADNLPEPFRSVATRLECLGGRVKVKQWVNFAYRPPPQLRLESTMSR